MISVRDFIKELRSIADGLEDALNRDVLTEGSVFGTWYSTIINNGEEYALELKLKCPQHR